MKCFFENHPEAEACMAALAERIDRANREICDGRASVLLLGSLSKGEGALLRESGREVLAGDVEFFTVYPRRCCRAALDAAVRAAAAECLAPLAPPEGLHCDVSPLSRLALPRMERKLLVYDAARFGVVLTGEDVRALLPQVNADTINRADVRDMVAHRALSVMQGRVRCGRDGHRYRYLLAKNALDLVTVLLLAKGHLATTTAERVARMESCCQSEEERRLLNCCAALRRGERCEEVPTAPLEQFFCSLLVRAHGALPFSFGNLLYNAPARLRRRLGVLRRALRYRHLPRRRGYTDRLIACCIAGGSPDAALLRDHLVLHGYPLPQSPQREVQP